MSNKKIWVVYNPNGSAPTHTHHSYDSAKQEAKRLARTHLDQSFFVMESIGMAKKSDVSWYVHEEDRPCLSYNDDEIPF